MGDVYSLPPPAILRITLPLRHGLRNSYLQHVVQQAPPVSTCSYALLYSYTRLARNRYRTLYSVARGLTISGPAAAEWGDVPLPPRHFSLSLSVYTQRTDSSSPIQHYSWQCRYDRNAGDSGRHRGKNVRALVRREEDSGKVPPSSTIRQRRSPCRITCRIQPIKCVRAHDRSAPIRKTGFIYRIYWELRRFTCIK